VVSYRTSKASKKKVEELRSSFNQLVSRLSPSSSYMKVGYRHCVRIAAIVGDRYREDYAEGFSTARIYNSSLKLNFLVGGSPQVIKPAMPFTCFVHSTHPRGVPHSFSGCASKNFWKYFSVFFSFFHEISYFSRNL
jgi:hypothetical protein